MITNKLLKIFKRKPKYKLYDCVLIRNDLSSNKEYRRNSGSDFKKSTVSCSEEMERYRGQVAMIVEVDISGGIYAIDIDNQMWVWTDDMFERRVRLKTTADSSLILSIYDE